MDIRDRVKQVLADNPTLTVRGVSLAAGLSDSMLHKFLTEQTRSMTVDTLESLATALGVNSRWLIFGDAPRLPDDKLVYIWDRIADLRREQALKVLETFADADQSQSA